MSEEFVIKHASPTLAGIKTANLFSCKCPSATALKRDIRHLNRRLAPKGVRLLPLKISERRALLYLYRPEQLAADLSSDEARALLAEKGYARETAAKCISHLASRLQEQAEFPHEIGLFLGYPLGDVRGFIEHQGKNCMYCGCWKVYENEAEARELFTRYQRCTHIYCKRWAAGCSLEQLTVASS